MGSCYAVTLHLKTRNEDPRDTVRAMQDFIGRTDTNTDWALDDWAKQGVGTASLNDLITIMLAGWSTQPVVKTRGRNGFANYRNGFDASYGWEWVMCELFKAIGPHLADGSYLYVDCDDGIDKLIVREGRIFQE